MQHLKKPLLATPQVVNGAAISITVVALLVVAVLILIIVMLLLKMRKLSRYNTLTLTQLFLTISVYTHVELLFPTTQQMWMQLFMMSLVRVQLSMRSSREVVLGL
jgi:hypothetical protein